MSMKKFLILASQRSGSTLLCTSLDGHPNIRCHGEVLMRKAHSADGYWKHCQQSMFSSLLHSIFTSQYGRHVPHRMQTSLLYPYLDQIFSPNPRSRPWKEISQWEEEYIDDTAEDHAVGFKLMHKQLKVNHSLNTYIKKQDISIIHLYRENLLDTFLSGKTLQKSGTAHSQSPEMPVKTHVHDLDIQELLNFIQHNQEMHTKQLNWLTKQADYHEVCYEELAGDFNTTMNTLGEFLGVEAFDFTQTLRKLNDATYSERIKNWTAVKKALHGVDYKLGKIQ